jgi:hypothetical protein
MLFVLLNIRSDAFVQRSSFVCTVLNSFLQGYAATGGAVAWCLRPFRRLLAEDAPPATARRFNLACGGPPAEKVGKRKQALGAIDMP